ncbi:hypothetical protein Tco_1248662 [Tanacetum coccineum]
MVIAEPGVRATTGLNNGLTSSELEARVCIQGERLDVLENFFRKKRLTAQDEWRTDRPGFSRVLAGLGVPVKGASVYPGVIITTCTSNLGIVERVTRLLFHSTTFVYVIHSLTERSSEGQPIHTANGEDGTTGKDRLAKTPQARTLVGLRRGSIRRKGSPDGGRARGGQVRPGRLQEFDYLRIIASFKTNLNEFFRKDMIDDDFNNKGV